MSGAALEPLSQSDSKADLFRRLGLEECNRGHRTLYSMMKDEAGAGWLRIVQNPNALHPSLRGASPCTTALSSSPLCASPPLPDGVRPAFSQIDEAVLHAEQARIYRDAHPATKLIYDLAVDPLAAADDPPADNWIIRWLLWHVFRYRDERNGKRTAARAADRDGIGVAHSPSSTGMSSPEVTHPAISTSPSMRASRIEKVQRRPTVRVSAVTDEDDQGEGEERRLGSRCSPAKCASDGFYDPVRDAWPCQCPPLAAESVKVETG